LRLKINPISTQATKSLQQEPRKKRKNFQKWLRLDELKEIMNLPKVQVKFYFEVEK
jgi:hypothetical protein